MKKSLVSALVLASALHAPVFAFAQSANAWTLESVETTAEELQFEFALEFPRFLRRLRRGHLLSRRKLTGAGGPGAAGIFRPRGAGGIR